MEQIPPAVLALLVSGLVAVVWYLLRQKDARQEEAIQALWREHDKDKGDLQALKLQIAKEHYSKSELDVKFDKLEGIFQEGLKDLGRKLEALTDTINKHINHGDKGG